MFGTAFESVVPESPFCEEIFRRTAVRSVNYFRLFTPFNLLLMLCVFFTQWLLLRLPRPQIPPLCLPLSLHQLPEELSVWIAALSVHPVRLRDAF